MPELILPHMEVVVEVCVNGVQGVWGGEGSKVTIIPTVSDKSFLIADCINGSAKFFSASIHVPDEEMDSVGFKALVFKVSVQGCAPQPLGRDEHSLIDQVNAKAAPVVFFATKAFNLADLCRDKQILRGVTVSPENPSYNFTLTVKTRYETTPKQVAFLNRLLQPEKCLDFDGVSVELATLSAAREQKIMAHLSRYASDNDVKNCQDLFIRCPVDNMFSLSYALDPCQLHHLSDAIAKHNREKYVPTLCAAAQQVLVRLATGKGGYTPALGLQCARDAGGSVQSRVLLVEYMRDAIMHQATANSWYTFDANISGFVMKPCKKGMTSNSLTPAIDKNGESQNLAGLMSVTTMHSRDSEMKRVRASIENMPISGEMKAKLLTQTKVAALKMMGDCEDVASLIRNTQIAASCFECNPSFMQAVQISLNTLLPHEVDTHGAIMTLLAAYRIGICESNDVTCTKMVFAASSHIGEASSAADSNIPEKTNMIFQELADGMNGRLAGHAVCGIFKPEESVECDGVSFVQIGRDFKTFEGTGDTSIFPGLSKQSVQMQLQMEDPTLQKIYGNFDGQYLDKCSAHNIMSSVAADTVSQMFDTAFVPGHKLDPASKNSFYQFGISFGPYTMITHCKGLAGVGCAIKTKTIESCVSTQSDFKNLQLIPCTSMILAKSDSSSKTAYPIGVTVHPCEREFLLINAVAKASQALFPTLEMSLEACRKSDFYLMPTASIQLPADGSGTKINGNIPLSPLVSMQSIGNELFCRTQIASRTGATHVQHMNSHAFCLHFNTA